MSKNVEYVSFTGNQFIDTGVRVTGNSTIELTYTYTSSTTGAVFGSRTNASGTDSVSFSMFVVNGDVRSDHFGTSKTLDKNTYNPKEKHTYKITPDAIYCDGKQVYTQGVSSNTTPSTLYIGAVKTNGSVEKYSTVNLYSFKIYHGNTLVRDFVPHKDDNEKFCLKDAIENKFYYSNNALQGPVDLSHIKTGDILNFDYTGAVQAIALPKGIYKLECWGAQGGYRSSSSYGGAGGYSIGTLSLSSKTTLYIYVGGSGNSVTSANSSGHYPGGFNGGGYRNTYKGGGGATDIRIGTDSLYSRVIVAGGGGSDGSSSQSGGYAGGTSGARGSFGYGSYGYGGNQTATYSSLNAIASQGTNNNSSDCAAGFGFGGFGCYSSSGYGGAGGGGWYGGQGTYPDGSGDDDGGGGGGSGYVYTSSTAKNYPQGCLLNSSYYLTDAQTIAGNQAFTSPEGTSETGHSGNGFCRITNMTPKQYGMFIKRNGAWTHIDL